MIDKLALQLESLGNIEGNSLNTDLGSFTMIFRCTCPYISLSSVIAFGIFMDVLFIPSNVYYCVSGSGWGIQSFHVHNDSTKQSSQFLTFEFQKKCLTPEGQQHQRKNSQAAEGLLACYF